MPFLASTNARTGTILESRSESTTARIINNNNKMYYLTIIKLLKIIIINQFKIIIIK